MTSGLENLDIDPVFIYFKWKVISFWFHWEQESFFFFSELFSGSTGSFFLLNSQPAWAVGNNSARLQKVPIQKLKTLTWKKTKDYIDIAKVYQILNLNLCFPTHLSFRNCLGADFHLLLPLVAWINLLRKISATRCSLFYLTDLLYVCVLLYLQICCVRA